MEQNEFLVFLEGWLKNLPAVKFAEIIDRSEKTALVSIDMINGFCNSGPLASPRVHATIQPVHDLFLTAWEAGVHEFILLQDTHKPDAVEFAQWPPHCIEGSIESQTIEEIRSLPFFGQIKVFPKNSINPAMSTGFQGWVDDHPQVETYIIVGDCTDLCTYQLAMYLRTDANARQIRRQIIAPANCIQTYDLPVEAAQKSGILPHPGDLMHRIFLYHMALNGIEVVSALEAK